MFLDNSSYKRQYYEILYLSHVGLNKGLNKNWLFSQVDSYSLKGHNLLGIH